MIWRNARGATVTLSDGRRYIDFTSGVVCTNLGHAAREVRLGIRQASNFPLYYAYKHDTSLRNEYTSALLSACKGIFENVAYFTTGAEAIEFALRLLHRHSRGKRQCVAAFSGAFHGKSLGAALLSDISRYRKPASLYSAKWVLRAPFPTDNRSFVKMQGVLRENEGRVSGIVIELVQGSTLQRIGTAAIEWLQVWCKKNNALLVIDEIQTGFCRLGDLFVYQKYGLHPDIVCASKGIANGFPISVGLMSGAAAKYYELELDSTTYMANPMGLAIALHCLRTFGSSQFTTTLSGNIDIFADSMLRLEGKWGKRAKILYPGGLLAGIRLIDQKTARSFAQKCISNGVLVLGPIGEERNIIKIAPPLTISRAELRKGTTLLQRAISN